MMVHAISGGPAPTGHEAGPKSSELPQSREAIRQASVASTKTATANPDPVTTQRSAAYGVASQAQTQNTNTTHDTKKKLPPEDRGVEAYDARGRAPSEDSTETEHKVDVEA